MNRNLPKHLLYDAYCDGGVIQKNPSIYGGVWAWCLVNPEGKKLECDSGVVEPKDLGVEKVTNNQLELYAAIQALEAMVAGWAGFLWTDSMVTYYRLCSSVKFNGIPQLLKEKCLRLRWGKTWTVMHLGGHPTKADLEVGFDRRGLKVSPYNVWCDGECRRQAKRFLARLTNGST